MPNNSPAQQAANQARQAAAAAGQQKKKDSSTQTITNAYKELLGRDPDPGGLAEYQRHFAGGGMSEYDLRKSIQNSAEFKNRSSGGGGGGAPGAGYMAGAGGPMNTNVQENPQMRALMDEFKGYQGSLAAGSDADATNAMARQRDVTSGMAGEAEQGAIFRTGGTGGVSDTMKGQQLQVGQRQQQGLNAALTSDARQKQLTALQGRGSLETAQAGITQGQQNFALDQWRSQQQAAQAAAQLAAMQQQNQFQNQMSMINSIHTGF